MRRPFELTPADFPVPHRPGGEFSEVEPVLALCRDGKLYEVETWIGEGRPLQYPPPEDRKLQRRSTALQIAVARRFHSLAALLLANGYDPNGDCYECLSLAVTAKDSELVDLLLRFGANPRDVDFCTVLETCDRGLMDCFIAAGVDPCRDNAVARALESRGRPIMGFVKQYRDRFPALQRQIDIALRVATEAESPRRTALMLWLGADPHAEVPATAEEDSRVKMVDDTAFERALWSTKPEILTQFLKRPIPPERVQPLLFQVSHRGRPELVRRLLDEGADPNAVNEDGYPALHGFISSLLWSLWSRAAEDRERGLAALEVMLKAGAKWSLTEGQLKGLRRELAEGESSIAIGLLDRLHHYQAVSAEQLRELTRTPAVRRVLNGISKPRRDPFGTYYSPVTSAAAPVVEPSRRGGWKRHWAQR